MFWYQSGKPPVCQPSRNLFHRRPQKELLPPLQPLPLSIGLSKQNLRVRVLFLPDEMNGVGASPRGRTRSDAPTLWTGASSLNHHFQKVLCHFRAQYPDEGDTTFGKNPFIYFDLNFVTLLCRGNI